MQSTSTSKSLPTVLWNTVLSYLATPNHTNISKHTPDLLSQCFHVSKLFHDTAFTLRYNGFIYGTKSLEVDDEDDSLLHSDKSVRSFRIFLDRLNHLYDDDHPCTKNNTNTTSRPRFALIADRYSDRTNCHLSLEISITQWQMMLVLLSKCVGSFLTKLTIDCGHNVLSYRKRRGSITDDEYSSFKIIRDITPRTFPNLTHLNASGLIDETDIRLFLEAQNEAEPFCKLEHFNVEYQCSDWHDASCVSTFMTLPTLLPHSLKSFVLPSMPNRTVDDQRNGDLLARHVLMHCGRSLAKLSYHWWSYRTGQWSGDGEYYDYQAYYRRNSGSDMDYFSPNSEYFSDSETSYSAGRRRSGRVGRDEIDMIVISPKTLSLMATHCPHIETISICVESIEECEGSITQLIDACQSSLVYMEIYVWKRFHDEVSFGGLRRKFQKYLDACDGCRMTSVICEMQPRLVLWVFE